MENSKSLFLIAISHVLFYWKFYRNPFIQSTSELIQNFFPHWKWLGQAKNIMRDDIFYKYPGSIPFLSTFYPPHYLSAKLTNRLSLDNSFIVLNFNILFHKLLGSVLSYFMFLQWYDAPIALYGAILLSYAQYMIKLQQPTIAYTMAWIPGCFIQGWFGAVSLGLALLAGYYPILIYMIPIILVNNPCSVLGIVLGLPQLIPFVTYMKRSVPYRGCSSIPLREFAHLIMRRTVTSSINNILTTETAMYVGIIPIILSLHSDSRMIYVLIVSFFGAWLSNARFLYPFTFAVAWLATNGLNSLSLDSYLLCVLQFYDLYRNHSTYPCFPFTEWWKRPSEFFKNPVPNTFPHNAGYISGLKTKGYKGCLRLDS